jgi:hypothetical protein
MISQLDDNPFGDPFETVMVLWDYTTQMVVDAGDVSNSLFDTHWVYKYRHGHRLPWVLSRYPGEVIFYLDHEVPELVRMAVMVAS